MEQKTWILILILIFSILILGILILCISKTIIAIYDKKTTFMSKQLDHEYKIKVLEFNQKKEWEDIITKKTNQKKMRIG